MTVHFSTLHRLTACIILVGLGINGCAVGPDFEKPESKSSSEFANTSESYSATEVSLNWWRQFNDAQLNKLIEQTLEHNFQVKMAQANLAEARALYLEAGLTLLPQITGHANDSQTFRSTAALNNRAFVPRGLDLYNAGFDASWEIDLFGRLRRNVEAIDNDIQQMDADLQAIRVSLAAETARNYFELRGLQQQLAVAEQNAENQAQTLALTQSKLANGRGTELDTSRAQAQWQTTRAGIPPIKTAIAANMHRLAVLCGKQPNELISELSTSAPLPQAPGTINIGNPGQLLQRRPDIRSAEHALAAATARIGVVTADLFPRVTFTGTLALESSTLGNMTGPGTNTYSFGPKISWAFLDMGRVYARIKAAGARAEGSLAQYQQTVLNALEETENALVSYDQACRRRTELSAAAAASNKASYLAHLRYQAGAADFLTVLDAEFRLLQDQSQLAQSETSTATALAAVYKSLGGGWEIEKAANDRLGVP